MKGPKDKVLKKKIEIEEPIENNPGTFSCFNEIVDDDDVSNVPNPPTTIEQNCKACLVIFVSNKYCFFYQLINLNVKQNRYGDKKKGRLLYKCLDKANNAKCFENAGKENILKCFDVNNKRFEPNSTCQPENGRLRNFNSTNNQLVQAENFCICCSEA